VANKFTVTHIFEFAIASGCSVQNVKSGFRRCGLFPFEESWPTTHKELFHLSEELDEKKRKRKLEGMSAEELPWEDIAHQMHEC
jgi:hypothetical protein